MLDRLFTLWSERGWLKARTHQRSDSAHVLAATRTHYRLENISETLRQVLNHLAMIAPTLAADYCRSR